MPERKTAAWADARIIATRELAVDGSRRKAIVTVREPTQVGDDEWWCAFHVTGMGRARRAIGGDALQALMIAIQGLRAWMNEKPGRYTWTGEPGDHGVPELVPWGFGMRWAAHIERVIERELTAFVKAELRRRRAARRKEKPDRTGR